MTMNLLILRDKGSDTLGYIGSDVHIEEVVVVDVIVATGDAIGKADVVCGRRYDKQTVFTVRTCEGLYRRRKRGCAFDIGQAAQIG